MLRCGPSVFAGNAGYRLPLPAGFPAGLPLGEQPAEGQWQHRAEVQIARKLQRIADQFHRLHMQQVGMGDFWRWGGGEGVRLLGLGGWGLPQQLCLCQAPRIRSQSFGLMLLCYSRGLDGPDWMSTLALTSEIQVVYLPTLSSGSREMLRSLPGDGIAFCSLD